MSERYAEIVLKEDIDYSGSTAVIDSDRATRYEPLRRITRPANNGHLDWTETIVLTYTDGTTERVRGSLVESGVLDE